MPRALLCYNFTKILIILIKLFPNLIISHLCAYKIFNLLIQIVANSETYWKFTHIFVTYRILIIFGQTHIEEFTSPVQADVRQLYRMFFYIIIQFI